jgi:hypothetical protein
MVSGHRVGRKRENDHLFAEHAGDGVATGAERQRMLRDVDLFENAWFPRTRMIIRRVVPRARRDAFEAAFFKNLEQQPLGPGVILSVSTFAQGAARGARGPDTGSEVEEEPEG